ncbi:MAG: SDR family NAD(P)-dependent oxidoreductase, partial [Micromonosporaceae bacterium]|nr:SDR family NAD(P)-dependent oxidoreductase [Micromonosporaceae bacterium]
MGGRAGIPLTLLCGRHIDAGGRRGEHGRVGRLTGRVALISGGEGSVGMATARAFVAEGARVALVGIDTDRLAAGERELGQAATATLADVTDADQ